MVKTIFAKRKLLQTIDLGSGDASHLLKKAVKNPRKLFMGVDNFYRKSFIRSEQKALPKNFRFLRMDALNALKRMQKRGFRSKKVELRMPGFLFTQIPQILESSKKVLTPGGSIYLTTEHVLSKDAILAAEKAGYIVKPLGVLKNPKTSFEKCCQMEGVAVNTYTFTLKKL